MDYSAHYFDQRLAAEAAVDARAAFIRRTYAHLAGAVLAFIGLEALIFKLVPAETIHNLVVGASASWLIVLLAFVGISWLANSWALSGASQGLQYAGLALYVVAEAFIFLPILYVAAFYARDDLLIPKAGVLTLCMFAGLSFIAFTTGKDFSFLRPILIMSSFVAIGLVVVSIFMGGGLGLWFSVAMVAVASGYILYDTSNILHHYRTDQHVAAALALFASVALLFWYILRIMLAASGRRD
jgi:FtsH-binding integral membrane protein